MGSRCSSSTTASCWQPIARSCCRQLREAAPRRDPTRRRRRLAAPLLQPSHLHLLCRHVAATFTAAGGAAMFVAAAASGGQRTCGSCRGSPTFPASTHLRCRRLPFEGCWCEGRCGRTVSAALATGGAAAVVGLMAGWGVLLRAGESRLRRRIRAHAGRGLNCDE